MTTVLYGMVTDPKYLDMARARIARVVVRCLRAPWRGGTGRHVVVQ